MESGGLIVTHCNRVTVNMTMAVGEKKHSHYSNSNPWRKRKMVIKI